MLNSPFSFLKLTLSPALSRSERGLLIGHPILFLLSKDQQVVLLLKDDSIAPKII